MNKKSAWVMAWLLLLSSRPAAAFQLDEIDIHGFISQGYLKSDLNDYYAKTKDGSFQFNEFGANIAIDITERLRAAMQLLSRDLGTSGNNEVNVDWAYGQYRWKDWLKFKMGRIQIPWGFYNETRDIDMLRPWIFLPPSLYNERVRDVYDAFLGAGIEGNIYVEPLGSFSYSVGYGEKDIDISSEIFNIEDKSLISDFECRVTEILGAKLEWDEPVSGLRLGATFGMYHINVHLEQSLIMIVPAETEGDEPTVLAQIGKFSEYQSSRYVIFSGEYTRGDTIFTGEYSVTWNKHGDDEQGYYLSIAHRFTSWFQAGTYYSAYYPDKDDKDGDAFAAENENRFEAWQKELVFTTRFDLNDNWQVKFEVHGVDGTAAINTIGVDSSEINQRSVLFAVKTTVSF